MANRKSEIVEHAYKILGEQGLEGLHARTVATSVGVNHAAVHYYFKTRPDLILAVLDHALSQFSLDRQSLVEANPTDRLKAQVNQTRLYAKLESQFLTVWLSCFLFAKENQAVRTELVRHLREWAFMLKLDLKSVKASNPLGDPETLVSVLIGIAMQAQLIGEDFDYRSKLKAILKSLS